MADARQRDEWSRAAKLCATVASAFSSKAWQPDDFMPEEMKTVTPSIISAGQLNLLFGRQTKKRA